jgi:hypothetical protein
MNRMGCLRLRFQNRFIFKQNPVYKAQLSLQGAILPGLWRM